MLHMLSVAWDWVPTTAAPRSEEEALPEGWDVLGGGGRVMRRRHLNWLLTELQALARQWKKTKLFLARED